jgi:phage host-nuclease inhibitor protein Gam
MAKRESKKVEVIDEVTRAEAEQFFAEYAEAAAKFDKLNAELELKLTAIRQKYQDALNATGLLKAEAYKKLEAFGLQNKELFTERRSMEFTHGRLGFRIGQPALKTLKGFTWTVVQTLLKRVAPEYVRVVEEPAKDMILADREKLGSEKLAELGLQVVQAESFYVEPKTENETVL